MNSDFVKAILAAIKCNATTCDECRWFFQTEVCPLYGTNKENLSKFVDEIIEKVSLKDGIDNITEEEFIQLFVDGLK